MNSKELARRVFNQLDGGETYWDKVQRICSSRNRIMRTDHAGAHQTTYVLEILSPKDGPLFLPVVCKTLSMMEVLNARNPKKCGLIHAV